MNTVARRAVAIFILAGFPSLVSGAWTTKQLTTNSGASENADIAANGPKIYVVWCDRTPGNAEIYFRKSIDHGKTWQSAKRLTNTPLESEHPRIAIAGENVYVAWDEGSQSSQDIYFRRSADGGRTWKAPQRLIKNAFLSEMSDLAATDRNVYAVWHEMPTSAWEIYFCRSIDGGKTWAAPQRLTYTEPGSLWGCLAASGNGVYLAWTEGHYKEEEIYFQRSADAGATWEAAQRLTDNADFSERPRLALSGKSVYLVWHDYSATGFAEIFFRKSADGGRTWKAARRLTFSVDEWGGHESAWVPDIAVRGTSLYVTYSSTLNGYWRDEVYFLHSPNGGTSWKTPVRLTANETDSSLPTIAVNDAKAFVAYHDDVTMNNEIYVASAPLGKLTGGPPASSRNPAARRAPVSRNR